MSNLQDRFRSLETLPAPGLWGEIEIRATRMRRAPANLALVMAAVAAFVVISTVGWVASIGSWGNGPASTAPAGSTIPSPAIVAGGWIATASMSGPRQGHGAVALPDGRVLVVGGYGSQPVGLNAARGLATAELYDPNLGTWAAASSMGTGRGDPSTVVLRDGRVLVFGGISLTGTDDGVRMVSGNVVLSSAELYDPRTDSWATTGSMAEGRSGATAILLPDGRVLAAGGWGATELFGPKLATAELYDPGTGTWTATGAMVAARDGHAAVLLPTGKVLVAGGYDRDRLASAELYDPIPGLWAPTGRLPERFITRIVLLLKDGRVLLAGGDVPSGPGAKGSAHAALYDVDTGTWTAAQPMLEGRLAASFALLPDGRVLVSGGRMYGAPDAVSFRTAEVYDPATGTWIATADLPGPRSGGSAVLLPDGRVLVVGGVGDGLEVLASAEIFALSGGS